MPSEHVRWQHGNVQHAGQRRLERAGALVEGHLYAVVLEGDDVSCIALGGELHAGGHVHIVEHWCECLREAIRYLRAGTRERERVEDSRRLAKIGEGEMA